MTLYNAQCTIGSMSNKKPTNVNFDGKVYAALQRFLRKLNKGKPKPKQVSQSAYVSDAVDKKLKADGAVKE